MESTVFRTTVSWKGERLGHLVMGNGPEMEFCAPAEAGGFEGLLTPEDAFVASINTCIMLMFLWACERFRLHLLSYECRAEGIRTVNIDRTEAFRQLRLQPMIRVSAMDEDPTAIEARTLRALQSARKYSLIASSINSELLIIPRIEITQEDC
jgi:organic hydroperoxide reductase OsmC/OhrA